MQAELKIPNVRKFLITDPGYVQFEADLKGAEAQVIAWEADDVDLKAAFRAGIDIHEHNAEAMWGVEFTKLPRGSHARDHKRQECKHTVHSIHNGGQPRTTAIQRGWLISEAEKFHRRWHQLHPGVERYHNRVRASLIKDRTVYNRFGFRRVYFDRIDDSFTKALAWIPQSTIAINSYLGALQLEKKYWPHHQERGYFPDGTSFEGLILQTHDSCNFQFPENEIPPIPDIRAALAVPIPFEDPLTIPWDLKWSKVSWGDTEKIK